MQTIYDKDFSYRGNVCISSRSKSELNHKDEVFHIIRAAEVRPEERTEKQIGILAGYLVNLDLIVLRTAKDMPKDFVKQVVKCFELEVFKKGAALYHHGTNKDI